MDTLPDRPSPTAAGQLALEIGGWAGTVLLLTAFVLNTTGSLPSRSALYLGMNAAGSAGVGLNALVKRTWPAFAVEAAWCVIALVGLGRLLLSPELGRPEASVHLPEERAGGCTMSG